jgi:hypothetical protein
MKLRKPSILVVNWVSSCLSFSLSASTAAAYIFTAPNCITTIISLGPCALNAEFQHFILRHGYFTDNSIIGEFFSNKPPNTAWFQAFPRLCSQHLLMYTTMTHQAFQATLHLYKL